MPHLSSAPTQTCSCWMWTHLLSFLYWRSCQKWLCLRNLPRSWNYLWPHYLQAFLGIDQDVSHQMQSWGEISLLGEVKGIWIKIIEEKNWESGGWPVSGFLVYWLEVLEVSYNWFHFWERRGDINWKKIVQKYINQHVLTKIGKA